jgi:sigma-E factor negative regulatory protein RseB
MQKFWLFRALGWAALSFVALGGAVRAAPSEQSVVLDSHEVRQWLLRIHEAAQHRNFKGTFVVTAGGQMASSRIAHYCEGPNQYERIETLDGQTRRVLRHNDLVATLWPDSRRAVVERRETLNAFPGLLKQDGARLVEHYEVRQQGMDRVAGHEAHVLELQPRDNYRYGYRLWSERSTGLLLRSDVISHGGDVLESSAFSEVSIGVKPQPDAVVRPMKKLQGYQVDRPELSKTSYEQEGWVYRKVVPGFRHVSCVKRSAGDASQGELLQTIFSDGLAHVSIFVEPYDATLHRKEMLMSMGATHTLTRRHGDWWITAVGEVPPATLREFVQGLERSK